PDDEDGVQARTARRRVPRVRAGRRAAAHTSCRSHRNGEKPVRWLEPRTRRARSLLRRRAPAPSAAGGTHPVAGTAGARGTAHAPDDERAVGDLHRRRAAARAAHGGAASRARVRHDRARVRARAVHERRRRAGRGGGDRTAPVRPRIAGPGRLRSAGAPAAPAARRAADAAQHRAEEDSRRSAPRAGALVGGRLLSDRLRGRARAAAGGTAPEGLAAEGRRGHAAVVRLRGVRGALLARRGTRRSRRSSRGLGARVAGVGRRGVPEGLSGDGRRGAVPARGSGSARVPAESVPDRQGAVRAEVRAQRPSRLGADSAAAPGGAGVRRTRMQKPKLVPPSTYRLQVHRGFTLHAARDVVPYLRRLGAGAAYTSPYFAAEPESTHGYDVTNHNEISEQVGGEAAHAAFTDALRDAGLQHIVDFVPNHMGISTATNPWWRDVLAHGPRSEYARFFDIDWNPFKSELRRKLLLPILGDQYGKVLERGELQVELNGEAEAGTAGVVLRYFDSRLPLTIPRRFDREEIERLNGIPGQPRSFDALHELLEAQAYRLAYWRTAAHEINY